MLSAAAVRLAKFARAKAYRTKVELYRPNLALRDRLDTIRKEERQLEHRAEMLAKFLTLRALMASREDGEEERPTLQ